jgi:hypothetical protein
MDRDRIERIRAKAAVNLTGEAAMSDVEFLLAQIDKLRQSQVNAKAQKRKDAKKRD